MSLWEEKEELPGFFECLGGSRVATENVKKRKAARKIDGLQHFNFDSSLSFSGLGLATLFLVRRRGGSKRAPVRIAPGAKMLWWRWRSPPATADLEKKKGGRFLPPSLSA